MADNTQTADDSTERLCPNCFQTNWEHVAKNPAAVTCKCNDCGHRFSATDAYVEGAQDPEAGFHNDPSAWSK